MVAEKAQGADLEEQFVQRMKLLREVQRISQGDLASRMVNAGWEYWRQTTVSRVEKLERTVRLAEAHNIAEILGLSLAEMLTVGEEIHNQNIGAAERRRDLDEWAGRLSESMASFRAELECFRNTLHQANTRQEIPAAVVAKAWSDLAPDSDGIVRVVTHPLALAAEEADKSPRLRKQESDDELTKAAHGGIYPEA